jgi:hypothetical protein
MKLTKTFNVDVYSCKVILIVTDNMHEEERNIYAKNNEEIEEYILSDGLTINFEHDKYYIVFKDTAITHNLISHEIYHLVCSITDYRGIEDEESRAWLAGYLAEIIYSYLDKKDITIKNGF